MKYKKGDILICCKRMSCIDDNKTHFIFNVGERHQIIDIKNQNEVKVSYGKNYFYFYINTPHHGSGYISNKLSDYMVDIKTNRKNKLKKIQNEI